MKIKGRPVKEKDLGAGGRDGWGVLVTLAKLYYSLGSLRVHKSPMGTYYN